MGLLAENKGALFSYETVTRYEAGIVLNGWEVKSVKGKRLSLKESFVIIKNDRAWLIGAHIARWPGANIVSEQEYRDKELLLNKRELVELSKGVKIKGQTIIPLNIHLSKNLIKLEIALAKGKKLYDKRVKLKEADQKRDIQRDLKHFGLK
jgi:SsrA-binding protein